MSKKFNSLYIVAFLIIFLGVKLILSATVSILPQPHCYSSWIKDIKCLDIIDDRLVPLGSRCQIDTVIGKCVLKNESGTFEYYPDCKMIVSNSSNISLNAYEFENYTHYTFTFNKIGHENIYFDFSCNNNRLEFGVWEKNYEVISSDNFWILQKTEQEAFRSWIIAILSIIVAICSIFATVIVAYYIKQKIVISDVSPELLNQLKEILSKKDSKKINNKILGVSKNLLSKKDNKIKKSISKNEK